MDKHERPFKCSDPACEKLSGFTYSGGLLRHQREVHGEYGGPKNPLNCPHVNCKRHTGKGFSRLENLNEHLRRVHTSAGASCSGDEIHEEMTGVGAHAATPAPAPIQLAQSQSPVILGEKRKADDSDDLRGEVKRLHTMNESLQQQLAAQKAQSEAKEEAQKQQMMAMMASMHDLKERLGQAEEQLRQQQQRGSMLDDAPAFP
jgi:hypothetical protein